MVQEYERAVIFRLGRLRKGGAKVEQYFKNFGCDISLESTKFLIFLGSWNIFCDTLCGPFPVCGYENCLFRCSSSGGELNYYQPQLIRHQGELEGTLFWSQYIQNFPDSLPRLCDCHGGRRGLLQCRHGRARPVQRRRLQVGRDFIQDFIQESFILFSWQLYAAKTEF